MAIYIKGMEMPDHCMECEIAIEDNDYDKHCPFTKVECLNIARQADCPLTEVPEPSAEQVTGKLKNPCNSLLTDDSAECKEQKSKLDLISRADAIKAVRFDTFNTLNADEREMVINRIPSADDDWIPCSERLPEIACRCLVTLSNNVVAIGTLHSDGECEDDFGYIVSWGNRWHLEPASMMIAYHEDSVTAWMPLPKSYKGGDSE